MIRPFRAVAGLTLFLLGGCVSAEEQRAADQQHCYGYGFPPGTPAFAQCMMGLDQQRVARDEARKDRDAGMLGLSQARNGNAAFPVCTAAMPGVSLDTVNNAWYGPNCRER